MKATLAPLGEPTSLRRLMRARALPLWEMRDATLGEDGPQPQPVPEYNSTCDRKSLVKVVATINQYGKSPGAAGGWLQQAEPPSPVVGRLVPAAIRRAGRAGRMTTGTERGGILMTFQGLSGATGSKFEFDAP